jgi:hypothetical protein
MLKLVSIQVGQFFAVHSVPTHPIGQVVVLSRTEIWMVHLVGWLPNAI